MQAKKLNSLKETLSKVPERFRNVFAFSFLTLGLVIGILAGGLSSSMFYETCSNYVANIVNSDAVNGDYLSLIAESDDEENHPLIASYSEFLATYGIFSESIATYASTINADKQHMIVAKEISESTNLSVLYANAFSNIEYNGHWKHEYYPIELMYKGDHARGDAYAFCYLSQSQADVLLTARGYEKGEDGNFSDEDYSSLIATQTVFVFDGTEYTFHIGNIYYETNYYYEALNSVMGDFVMCWTRSPSGFEKQGLYFMDRYQFHNEYYMKHINESYNLDNYRFRVNNNNVAGSFDENAVLSFYNEKQSDNGFKTSTMWMLFVLGGCFASVSLILIKHWLIMKKVKNILILMPFSLCPYLFFKLIFVLTQNVYLFSTAGMVFNSLVLVAFFVIYFVLFLISNAPNTKENKQ